MRNRNAAFTLIETVLYLAIAVSMMLAIAGFLTIILQARVRYLAITEVEQQGSFAMDVIGKNLRGAQTLISPAPGVTANSLSLTNVSAADNPVSYSLDGSQALIESLGSSAAYNLTSPRVKVTTLEFTNGTAGSAPGLVRVHLTLNYNSGAGLGGAYNYQADFYDSFSLR